MGVETNKSSDQEIDLVYYLGVLKIAAKKTIAGLSRYLHLLWRNAFVFLLILILIAGAAYSLRYVIEPAYRTEGMFISHFLPAHYYATMINDLDQLLDDENRSVVGEQLGIPPDVAGKIKHLELQPLRDTILERSDTVLAPFRITLLLQDMDQLEQIQQGIINYLEGQKRFALNNKSITPAGKETALPQIEILRPFLKRLHPNYPSYKNYFICGLIIGAVVAVILTPLIGKKT